MLKQKDPTIQIKLSEFMESFLGDADWNIITNRKLAEYLQVISRDTFLCAVQFYDEQGEPLVYPRLWRWSRWQESCDKWEAAKIRSARERVQRFLFEANVKIVTRACITYFMMDEKFASATAYAAVKNNKIDLLKELNVTLKTKEEEL